MRAICLSLCLQRLTATELAGLSTVSTMCRVAPDESALGNATVLGAVLPTVDAIIQTLQYNATDKIITFSASMDPGAPHASRTLPVLLHVACMLFGPVDGGTDSAVTT